MCKFLTGKARLQQTDLIRTWKLLDNELFKANDGKIYMAPRNMYTDNFTIPLFLCWLAGSPVDYDTRCSHIHDSCCYWHEALIVTLTEEELKEKGYLRYSEKNKMWVCEDIPVEFLRKEKISKFRTNNIFYECLVSCNVPFIIRISYRIAVSFNLNWFIYKWLGRVFPLELNRVYDELYWREHVVNWQRPLFSF